jgi:hypothetical protein
VIRRVLKMAHRGTRVVLIAGNHDEMLRPYAGMSFGGVELALEAIHTTADGRRLLVTHGDGFDGVVLYARWLAFLGDKAYEFLLRANRWFNLLRRQFKLPYWSLSAYLKKRVKNAVQFVCDFEEAVARGARTGRGRRGLRPHPLRRDPPDRRCDLLQRWRLGRKLHRAGRGSSGRDRHRRLGSGNARGGDEARQALRPVHRARGGTGMRIAICTDAWHPQVNGVVRTLSTTVDRLNARGHEVELITPSQFRTLPLPGYSEIRLAMAPRFGTRRTLKDFAPDVVHIATEGPIGWSARGWCKSTGTPFTTAFHTRFPDYARCAPGWTPRTSGR